jgi:hypothetical protein
MFKKRSNADNVPAESAPTDASGKGRATPSRREAEASRKQALKVPKDPKAAKAAARDRDRQARADARAGIMVGDEKHLPMRDRGPVRRYVRDFVDSKFSLAEYFIFIAVGILVLGFIPNSQVSTFVSIAWFTVLVLVIVDIASVLFRLHRALRGYFPEAADRKGVSLYAILRLLQMLRLRLPKPQVRRGTPAPPPVK